MPLSLLRVSGGFSGADRYSKQQLHVWSQHKLRTLFYGRASGTGRSPRWVWKIVSFRLWCAPERTGICQSRPGSAEHSVQFILGADCVINREINNHCCQIGSTVA